MRQQRLTEKQNQWWKRFVRETIFSIVSTEQKADLKTVKRQQRQDGFTENIIISLMCLCVCFSRKTEASESFIVSDMQLPKIGQKMQQRHDNSRQTHIPLLLLESLSQWWKDCKIKEREREKCQRQEEDYIWEEDCWWWRCWQLSLFFFIRDRKIPLTCLQKDMKDRYSTHRSMPS